MLTDKRIKFYEVRSFQDFIVLTEMLYQTKLFQTSSRYYCCCVPLVVMSLSLVVVMVMVELLLRILLMMIDEVVSVTVMFLRLSRSF